MRKNVIYSRVITLTIFFAIISFTNPCYSKRDLPDNNLSYPVLIVLDNMKTGSGFYRTKGNVIYLVTAKHVLFEYPYVETKNLPSIQNMPDNLKRKMQFVKREGKLEFNGEMSDKEKEQLLKNFSFRETIETLYEKSKQPLKLKSNKATFLSYRPNIEEHPQNVFEIDLKEFYKDGRILYHPSSDVAAIKLGKVKGRMGKGGKIITYGVKRLSPKRVHFVSVDDKGFKTFNEVLVSNEVFTFGYPTSISGLSPYIDIRVPLLRKGIIAGKNQELELIIVDCPAFYGNSGGLVIERECLTSKEGSWLAIGIVTQLVPFVKDWTENSGYTIVVPMDRIEELLSKDLEMSDK